MHFRRLVTLFAAVMIITTWPTPAQASSNSFIDDDTSRYEPFIETAKQEGLIQGCNPPDNNRVCPHHVVTRGSMAIMLARAMGAQPSSANHFTDDNGHVAEGAIDALMDAGISKGCEKRRFCPDRPISRGEMAALLTRAFDWGRHANPAEYADLNGSPFSDPLADLAARGGLLACDPPINRRLCPDSAVRRDEAVFALVSVLDLKPTTSTRENASGAPTLDFGDGFYDLSLWDGRSPSSRNRVSITSKGFHGTGLRVQIPEGSHFGADFKLHLEDAADVVPEQLFFRYYIKFDEDWRTTSSGKLPGFSGVYGSSGKGGYQSSPDDPGWSARLKFGPNHTTDDRIDLGYYVYHLGQETRYGDGLNWNDAGKLRPGDWYCLEGEVEMNTPGMADGALRAWVDEIPAFDLSGLEFRRPNEPEIKIESFWFDVYYGGKAVAIQDLGLTVDEVIVDTQKIGCGASKSTSAAEGDFNGDGYRDRVRWETCPVGTCFRLDTNHWSGSKTIRHNGDGAWFSLDSHRFGLAGGDVDGDGKADVVYQGRCDASTECWRVHRARDRLGNGENWGDGARFSSLTESLVLGDWNGDGMDDLAYQGRCAKNDRPCWRVHASSGSGFTKPGNWGTPPNLPVSPSAADITGDGRDDLVYEAPCDESRCWFAQVSGKDGFQQPVALGQATEPAKGGIEWIDFDGDATADLVSWANSSGQSWIEVRFTRDLELSSAVSLAELRRHIQDIAMRRIDHRETVQVVVEVACGGGKTCLRRLMAPSPHRLVDSERFLEVRLDQPGAPRIE